MNRPGCLIFLLVTLFSPVLIIGQTCCSGGVPISSSLGLPSGTPSTLQLSLNYDLNVLQTLKTGREGLNDDSRTRRTHSALFQAGYSLTDRISVDALFSWVWQERSINQFGNNDFTSTNGIGDAVLLFKYKLYSTADNRTTVTTALGAKAPLGQSDLKRNDGLTINADLQPGSGAWDGIAWGQLVHVLNLRPSMSYNATAVYGFKGKNNSYLGSQTYQFGNELQLTAGLADRFLIGQVIIDPSVSLRFRHVRPDRLNDNDLPSTGGTWVFVNPGFSYWLTPQYAFTTRLEIPLYANITGTQVTPTYRINIGLSAKINLKKKEVPFSGLAN